MAMDTRIPTVIVDDHDHARTFIRRFVEMSFPDDIVIVEEAHSVDTALEAIRRTEPRLLFLDIDLGDGNGFELLDLLEARRERMQVIIVTAFHHHSKAALRYQAAEYLDKPVIPKEFREGVARVIAKIRTMLANEAALHDVEALRSERDAFAAQLRLQTNVSTAPLVYTVRHQSPTNPVTEIPLHDILSCEGKKDWTIIHRAGSTKTVEVSKSIGMVEKDLAKYPFFLRIGRSSLINLKHCSVVDNTQKNEICVTVPRLGELFVEPAYKDAVRTAIMPFLREQEHP